MNHLNHLTKRILLGSSLALSSVACIATIAPRVVAWNQASQGALIASSRAVNCRVLSKPIVPNIIPVDGKTAKPLPPGTFLCDWEGMTAQINRTGAVDYLRQGQTESIVSTLKGRGFKPPY